MSMKALLSDIYELLLLPKHTHNCSLYWYSLALQVSSALEFKIKMCLNDNMFIVYHVFLMPLFIAVIVQTQTSEQWLGFEYQS